MTLSRLLVACGVALFTTQAAFADTLPRLTIASQSGGTVNWELQTILHHGLDRAQGFELAVMEVSGKSAGQIAFQGGEADIIVDDWIWVARQRAAGQDMGFLPYSRAVGGLMVPADSPAQSLQDLAGQQIGIAGGPVDKSWIVLRAYASQQGFDLLNETEQVFGAPPLLYRTALSGDLGGVINFWHFMAKQEAAGMRHLISVDEAAQALGMDPDLPLLGYVVRGDVVADQPELVAAFAAASRAAKDILAQSAEDWTRLRPIMNAADEGEFQALVHGFRAGIPSPGPINEDNARALFALMVELGGSDLVGEATALPDGVFLSLSQPGG